MWEREMESHVGHTAGGAGKLGCLSQASLQGLQREGPGSLSLLFIAFDQVGHRAAGTGLSPASLHASWHHTMEANGRRNAFPFSGSLLEKEGGRTWRGFVFNVNEV